VFGRCLFRLLQRNVLVHDVDGQVHDLAIVVGCHAGIVDDIVVPLHNLFAPYRVVVIVVDGGGGG